MEASPSQADSSKALSQSQDRDIQVRHRRQRAPELGNTTGPLGTPESADGRQAGLGELCKKLRWAKPASSNRLKMLWPEGESAFFFTNFANLHKSAHYQCLASPSLCSLPTSKVTGPWGADVNGQVVVERWVSSRLLFLGWQLVGVKCLLSLSFPI